MHCCDITELQTHIGRHVTIYRHMMPGERDEHLCAKGARNWAAMYVHGLQVHVYDQCDKVPTAGERVFGH